MKSYIDYIVMECDKPTFAPAMLSSIFQHHSEEDQVHVTTFVMTHAVQILLFALVQWTGDRFYSRGKDDYLHRYPTPAGYDCDDKDCGWSLLCGGLTPCGCYVPAYSIQKDL